ncbi:MAG TPA: hypothetical protein VK760_14620 [Candidatus Acidoferrales bacterium]|nr:hypothetical protein [Candidatus Acidoferrales bacterium]
MHADFSIAAKSARAALAVPAVPLERIVNRSRALGNRDRLRSVVLCGAMVLAAAAATTVGTRLYSGIQIWLSGNRAAVIVHSMAIVSPPLGNDLRALAAKATFPVTYPVGLPDGTRITRVIYAPADHPTSLTLQYLNPRSGFSAGLTLVDPAVVNATNLPASGGGQAPWFSTVDQWRVGGETVIGLMGKIAPANVRAIQDAMRSTSPSASLSASEAMLWKLRSVGAPYQLADTAERLAPNGAVVGRGDLPLIPGLARTHQPLLSTRVTYLTNIPYKKGVPQYNSASMRWDRDAIVPADGVRAIAAVLAAAGESGHETACCELLYTAPSNGTYTIWTLPVSASAPVKKYLVDAKTYRVRPG